MSTLSYDREKLRAELERDEGRRARAYQDTEGIWTIGVGWNLEANALPDDVIDRLLELSIGEAEKTLDGYLRDWRKLDEDRQRVLLNMAFNLGASRLAGFKRLKSCLVGYLATGRASWLRHAADEMLASEWSNQVGPRATRLADRMRGGPA